MSYSITSGNKHGCKCGGKFKQVPSEVYKLSIPLCDKCGQLAPRLEIRSWLPGIDPGKGQKCYIRRDKEKNPITSVIQAIQLMGIVQNEIKTQTFDAREYGSRAAIDVLTLDYFWRVNFLPNQENKIKRNELAWGTVNLRKGQYRVHLKETFGKLNLRDINTGRIRAWYDSYTTGLNAMDDACGLLRVIIGYAEELGMIKEKPKFPKPLETNYRDPAKTPSVEVSSKIIDHVKNRRPSVELIYQIAIRFLQEVPIRPCELQGFIESDINYKESEMGFHTHFSGPRRTRGSKSNKEVHYVVLTPYIRGLLAQLPYRSTDPSAPVFQIKPGKPLYEGALRKAWNRARDLAGHPGIEFYVGTKHCKIQKLFDDGFSAKDIKELTNHTTEKMLSHYGGLKRKNKLEIQRKMLK